NDKDSVWKPLALAAPSKAVQEVGKFERDPAVKVPQILLQGLKDGKWRDGTAAKPQIYSKLPLVGLPGCTSTLLLKGGGLNLKLLGALPEETPSAQLVREATVELHAHDVLDLDFTLLRGKLILTNQKDKPAQVRLRFSNPTEPEKNEVWDL